MTPSPSQLRDRVEAVLDRLRPALVVDGGDVELLHVHEDGTVQVVLLGACATCPAQLATLRFGLEEPIRAAVPQVSAVVLVAGEANEPTSPR